MSIIPAVEERFTASLVKSSSVAIHQFVKVQGNGCIVQKRVPSALPNTYDSAQAFPNNSAQTWPDTSTMAAHTVCPAASFYIWPKGIAIGAYLSGTFGILPTLWVFGALCHCSLICAN